MARRALKAIHRSKALVLLDRGLSVDETIRFLQARYHPSASLEAVRKAYSPRAGSHSISNLESKGRAEILTALGRFRRMSERLKRLNENPDFAAARKKRSSEIMRRLHNNPAFAEARDARIRALNRDPEFAKRRNELARARMKSRNQDPEYVKWLRERFRLLNQNPDFAEKRDERSREIMTKLQQDPEFTKHRSAAASA